MLLPPLFQFILNCSFHFHFTKRNCDVSMIPFVASFAHLSANSFPLIPICADTHTNIIFSPIILIPHSVCCNSIKTSGLPSDLLIFKLINEELESEHITAQRSHLFNHCNAYKISIIHGDMHKIMIFILYFKFYFKTRLEGHKNTHCQGIIYLFYYYYYMKDGIW